MLVSMLELRKVERLAREEESESEEEESSEEEEEEDGDDDEDEENYENEIYQMVGRGELTTEEEINAVAFGSSITVKR